jgi:hypothetical protein
MCTYTLLTWGIAGAGAVVSALQQQHIDLREFHTTVSKWIAEIHRDVKQDGYISSTPVSLSGKKLIELRDHCMSRSTEMASIRMHTRQTRTTAWHILRRFLYFLGEGFLPILLAVTVGAYIYLLYQPSALQQQQQQQSTAPVPWYSPQQFAIISGELVGAVLGTIKTFGSTALDTTTGIPNVLSKVQLWTFTLCATWLVYVATLPCTGLLVRARTASEKREKVQMLQFDFAHEYKNRVEQALYITLTRPILETMEHLLASSSQTASADDQQSIMRVAGTYSTNYELLYYSMLSQLEMRIRSMDTASLLRAVPQNAQFMTLLYRLIRESEDEFARNLMVFHQGLTDVSGQMKTALMDTLYDAYSTTQKEVVKPAVNMLLL